MAGNIRIPKRVGTVKLPRKVRKKANKAIKAATSPFVRDFATAAMAAAGRARRDGPRPAGGDGDGGESASESRVFRHETHIEIDGSKVAEAFRAAAIDGVRRFLEGLEEGLRKLQGEERDEPQPEPRARRARPAAPAAPAAAKAPKAAAKPKRPAKPGAPAKPKAKPRRKASGRSPASGAAGA